MTTLGKANKKMNKKVKPSEDSISRRSFLRKGLAAGAGTVAFGLLANKAEASGGLTPGDAAILRFLAALETLETDFWQQYNELGGIQDSEVPGGTGNKPYTAALEVLDSDMAQYVSTTIPKMSSRTSPSSTPIWLSMACSQPIWRSSARCQAARRPARSKFSGSPT